MILVLIIALLFLSLFHFILKPFIQLLIIKIKFGKEANLNFIPILGNVREESQSQKLYNDDFESFRQQFKRNPKLKFILSNIFNKPFILIGDPEYTKLVYQNHENYEKYDFLNFNTKLLGKGLGFTSGDKWKKQRNFLGDYFNYEKIMALLPMINQTVVQHLDSMGTQTILNLTQSISGDVIFKFFFGSSSQNLILNNKKLPLEIVQIFNDIAETVFGSLFVFLKWMLLGERQWTFFPTKAEKNIINRVDKMNDVIKNLVEEQAKNDKNSFIRAYMNEFNNDISEIQSQFITLVFAGTDSTSCVVTLCLYFLALYPDCYSALEEEIFRVMGDSQDVKQQHLNNLIEMNSFIQEALRLRNPASGPLIRVVKQDMILKDLKLKKGWIIISANFVLQQRENHFQNPSQFDPKRFNKNPISNDNGFVNVPFSAGPRNCIGQHLAMIEIKVILCHIIRRYKIIIDSSKKIRWESKFFYLFEPDNCINLIDKNS